MYNIRIFIYTRSPALFICISDQKWLEIIQQAASVRLTWSSPGTSPRALEGSATISSSRCLGLSMEITMGFLPPLVVWWLDDWMMFGWCLDVWMTSWQVGSDECWLWIRMGLPSGANEIMFGGWATLWVQPGFHVMLGGCKPRQSQFSVFWAFSLCKNQTSLTQKNAKTLCHTVFHA